MADMTQLNNSANKSDHPFYPKSDPVEPGIHIAFIKAELARSGYTQSKVAKELRVTPAMVNYIMKGQCRSRRIADFIALKTGLTIEQMWPGRYPDEIEAQE